MKELKPVEQYEVIRLLLATRTKDVLVCTHDSTNESICLIMKCRIPLRDRVCPRSAMVGADSCSATSINSFRDSFNDLGNMIIRLFTFEVSIMTCKEVNSEQK